MVSVPALIAGAGKRASLRFLEFFTVAIRNKNTRKAYARAAAAFLHWCEAKGIDRLQDVQPVHVAGYVEQLGREMSPPSVKQHLACIRMLFDWLVTGQVIPLNPAHAVRGPRHSVSKGSTPVLSSEEATALLKDMDVSTVVGLRDRALIAVMTYTFARVGAVVALNVEDYYPQKKRWWLRLREKNGKVNEMPCHHKLEAYLDAYISAAGIADDRKEPLFRAAIGRTKKLGPGAMSRTDVWYMVRRRASDASIETSIGCHTFRATGITDYLTNGGRIEVAQRMAGHSNAKTTGLYDRRNDDISVGEVERIGI
jgi:site-specific recombinase XerD